MTRSAAKTRLLRVEHEFAESKGDSKESDDMDKRRDLSLTEVNFDREVLESSQPVLVDFWAAWCGPCRMIAPAIEELATDFQGSAKVGKVDVDAQGALAARFGVQSIPTLLFFHNGEVVDQVIGGVPKSALAAKLSALSQAA